jgi:hypothetical protein
MTAETTRVVQPPAIAIVIGAVAIAAALSISSGLGAAEPGCAPLETSIRENASFTPYEMQRSRAAEVPITSIGSIGNAAVPTSARLPVAAVDGLDVQWAVVTLGGTYQYLLDRPLPPDMTTSEFLASGGIQYDRDKVDGEPFPQYLVNEVPDRATPVRVGGYDGVLTWADPIVNGVRSHNLYWSDGEFNYSLIADRPAVALVDMGRSIACAP